MNWCLTWSFMDNTSQTTLPKHDQRQQKSLQAPIAFLRRPAAGAYILWNQTPDERCDSQAARRREARVSKCHPGRKLSRMGRPFLGRSQKFVGKSVIRKSAQLWQKTQDTSASHSRLGVGLTTPGGFSYNCPTFLARIKPEWNRISP